MDPQRRTQLQRGFRVGLMATGLLALLGGLWGGLLRLGWTGPTFHPTLPAAHGPLMVCGVLGTVISLERAVALDRSWAFVAPGCAGVGAVLVFTGIGGVLGPVFVTVGSVGLLAIFGVVLTIQPAAFAVVMAGGAGAWVVGNGLWLIGWPVHALVPWWIGFLVLTIAGERLELSRMLFHAPWTTSLFLSLTALLGAGLVLSVSAPDLGVRVMGAGLGAMALWLGVFDVARRTVGATGLERFIGVCLLTGYGWLLVAGGLALAYGNPGAGMRYDAILHAVFVGFVFSMIFGHAPVIFPSVLGVSIPYWPAFFVHVGLLHGSLLLRIGGDIWRLSSFRRMGAWGNVVAILLFLGLTIAAVAYGSDSHGVATPTPSAGLEGHAATSSTGTPEGDSIPDLDLPSD